MTKPVEEDPTPEEANSALLEEAIEALSAAERQAAESVARLAEARRAVESARGDIPLKVSLRERDAIHRGIAVGTDAAAGAAMGTLSGAIVGALIGGVLFMPGLGAILGASVGAARGALRQNEER